MSTLTIITEPIPSRKNYYWNKIKSLIRPFLRLIDGKKPLVKPKYTGHFAVTRSLIEGLRNNKIRFIYNPKNNNKLSKIILVLADKNALKQIINLKRSGYKFKLFVGPNVFVSPIESRIEQFDEYIDYYIVNSNWTQEFFEQQFEKVKNRLIIWPAGVNVKYWCPTNAIRTNVIIYIKTRNYPLINECIQILKGKGINYSFIIYGQYTMEEYREKLSNSYLLIHFTESESQGISILEAWAMDVVTFVWNPKLFFYNEKFFECSSAPFISNLTGNFFKNSNEFKVLLENFNSKNYDPKEWVINNMTDEISSKMLINKIYELL